MVVVIVAFLVAAVRLLTGGRITGPIVSRDRFTIRRRWDTSAVFGGTAIAVLTYIGFDGISDALRGSRESAPQHPPGHGAHLPRDRHPRRHSGVRRPAAHPWTAPFENQETAFGLAASKAGSLALAHHRLDAPGRQHRVRRRCPARRGAAALRHGRSGALPKGFFGYIDPVRRVPSKNVIFVGVVALVGSLFMDFGLGADLLNFGALIAFMGVNLATFVHYFVREQAAHPGQLGAASRGVRHLRPALDQSQPHGQDRGRHLDGGRHRVRGLEDSRFPRRAGELRSATRRRLTRIPRSEHHGISSTLPLVARASSARCAAAASESGKVAPIRTSSSPFSIHRKTSPARSVSSSRVAV